MTKTKEVSTTLSADKKALLDQSFPVEQGFTKVALPRLGFFSQDVTEGKGKAMKVVTEAGTFYKELVTGETDDKGKKVYEKTELGPTIEGIIIYQRRQLKYYDESSQTFTSSPIFDEDDEIIPLFQNGAEICRGTAKELKARPEFQTSKDGKVFSKLEENQVLYMLYNEELYQMTIRGSSMFSYKDYRKEIGNPSSVLTNIDSEYMEKGSISWNKMIFSKTRDITDDEFEVVVKSQNDLRTAIKMEKNYYASVDSSQPKKATEEHLAIGGVNPDDF